LSRLPIIIKTSSFQLRKIFIIVAAGLMLPALTHAKDIDWGKGDKGDKGENSDKDDRGGKGEKGDPRVSSVPEANTAWVLLPFVGAVLLFSTRQLFLRKATE
jgi:hypothetical protein